MFMLSAQYRSPINFSREMIEQAKASLDRLYTARDHYLFLLQNAKEGEMGEKEQALLEKVNAAREGFDAAMDDDLNTADAISVIFELVKLANTTVNETSSKEYCTYVIDTMHLLCDILGIETEREQELLDEEIEQMIEERQQARKNRDFAKADEIRNALLEKGIALEDTREGVKWKKI